MFDLCIAGGTKRGVVLDAMNLLPTEQGFTIESKKLEKRLKTLKTKRNQATGAA